MIRENPIKEYVRAVAKSPSPVREFHHLLERNKSKITFTYTDMLWLWRYCSENLSHDEYQYFCVVIFKEMIVRQDTTQEGQVLWRDIIDDENAYRTMKTFTGYFERNKMNLEKAQEYLNEFDQKLSAIIVEIAKEIVKLRKNSEKAAKNAELARETVLSVFHTVLEYGRKALGRAT